MSSSEQRLVGGRAGGLRLQLFAAMAIAVLAAAAAAGVTAYHVFDRELERALEARLGMLVAETGRVLDAGIAAGLDLDRPQLQRRALAGVQADLGADVVVAVIDDSGRIVASSNPAEIGEMLPVPDAGTLPETGGGAMPAGDGRIVIVRAVQSLFGAPAGHVVAQAAPGVLDQPRRAFLARMSFAAAAVTLIGLVLAGLAAAFLPWRARAVAFGIERTMAGLYDGIGSDRPPAAPPAAVPAEMRGEIERFAAAVAAREQALRAEAAAVDQLDEAA